MHFAPRVGGWVQICRLLHGGIRCISPDLAAAGSAGLASPHFPPFLPYGASSRRPPPPPPAARPEVSPRRRLITRRGGRGRGGCPPGARATAARRRRAHRS